MLHFIAKQRYLYPIVVVALLAAAVYLFLISPRILPTEASFFYPLFSSLFALKGGWIALIFTGNLILQLLLLYAYTRKCDILSAKSNLPQVLFLIFLLIPLFKIGISPMLFLNTLMLLVLCLSNNDVSKYNTQNFYVGFLIGIMLLVDFSTIALLLYAIVAIFLSEFSKLKHFLQIIFGVLIVMLYAFLYYFFTNQAELAIPQFFTTIQNYDIYLKSNIFSSQYIGFILVVIFSLVILGINRIKFGNKLIVTRQKLAIFQLFAFFSIIVAIFTSFPHHIENGYLIVFLPILLAIYMENNKMRIVNELIFLIICLGLWL